MELYPNMKVRKRKVKNTKPSKSSFSQQNCYKKRENIYTKPKKSVTNKNIQKPKVDTTKYNITYVDSFIKDYLKSKIKNSDTLENELRNVKYIRDNTDDISQKTLAEYKINHIRKEINDCTTTFCLGLYIYRTADLIDMYKKLISKNKVNSFIQTKNSQIDKSKIDNIVNQYLCIAREYIDLENFTKDKFIFVCEACSGTNLILSDDDELVYICNDCQNEHPIYDDTPSFKDTDRVNMSSKYTYSVKGHFIDAIKKYQGIQNTDSKKINKVIEILKEQIAQHSLSINKDDYNFVTKNHIYMLLSELDLSKYYEHLNLIYNLLTGIECPNISHLVDDLLSDYDILEEVLEKLTEGRRDNSLTVNYKLYKLLQRRGYPCSISDFYVLKTKDTEDEHDSIMREAFEILGWTWLPTI